MGTDVLFLNQVSYNIPFTEQRKMFQYTIFKVPYYLLSHLSSHRYNFHMFWRLLELKCFSLWY